MIFKLISGKIKKSTMQAAAFDLFADIPEAVGILPGELRAIPTGVKSEFSPDLVCIIKEKSGLALKGLEVHGGVIDADYRDEWKVILRYNVPNPMVNGEPFVINPGDKIAQVMLIELPTVVMVEEGLTATIEIDQKARIGGFGSTGQ